MKNKICGRRNFAGSPKTTDVKLRSSFCDVTGFVIIVALALLVSGVFVVFLFTPLVNLIIDKVGVRKILYFFLFIIILTFQLHRYWVHKARDSE